MPWTANELWVGDVTADGIANAVRVAGGAAESVFQPEWSPSGALYFVSDRTNWWNLYRWQRGRIDALCDTPADFGQAQWTFGMSTYCLLDDTRIACSYLTRGLGKLAVLDLRTGSLVPLAVPETEFASVRGAGETIYYVGGSPASPAAAVKVDSASGTRAVLRASTVIDERFAAYLTSPRTVEFPTTDDRTAFALYYPPHNPDYVAPDGDKPPLLVKCHGGPTSIATSTLDLSTQFWTSRGIAVLDVNYGGSTGFGREYRDRLHLKWGIVDVDDCVNGAQYLVARAEVDGERIVMTGGSAGGYTTLAALAFKQCFRAGASLYGISDLAALARDTHKFELHYMDWLVAPFPAGEAVFKERSPLFHLEGFSAPVIFFQGSEDRVVPQNQTETIVERLRERGVLVSYFLYNGEGHGFRNPDNIRNTLDAQLLFFDLSVFRSGLTFGARRRG
jgi:dipeptidyl aminopeptidase/acylaminoacyl peptidase